MAIARKDINMNYMNSTDQITCHAIIHSASAAAGATGVGLAWFPGSDAPLISAVQIAMAIALARVFGIHLTEATARGAVAAAAATAAGRAATQTAVFWIPLLRSAVNATTAIGLTEYIGWTLAEEFAKKNQAESNW